MIAAGAIVDAITGVLSGALGSVRTIPAGRFATDLHDDSSDAEAWVRGRHGAAGTLQAQADVRIGAALHTTWVGPPSADLGLWLLPIDVVLRYAAEPYADLDATRRRTIREQALTDAHLVSLALMWPGQLTVDTGGTPTGITSGLLHQRAAPRISREQFADNLGRYTAEIPFEAWVQTAQPVS
jgi:hypothetical protein